MEPSWYQNRSEIDVIFEGRFFEKSCSRCSGSTIFEIMGFEVGPKNASKIDSKIYSKIKCVLASIFHDFYRFWEASWDRNWSKNRYKTTSKNSENLDAFWKRLGRGFR